MNILIAGARGRLGAQLARFLESGKTPFGRSPFVSGQDNVFAPSSAQLDIADREAVFSFCRGNKIGIVFNCAAYTDVDGSESDPARAFAVNAHGAENLAAAMAERGGKLVHVSTDYVFDGKKRLPYTEEDGCAPLNVYGRSKLEGEKLVLAALPGAVILRTAWLYGRTGGSFIDAVRRIASSRGVVRAASDQFGTPTFAEDVAWHMLRLAAEDLRGVFHATCEGSCSRYEFAREIVRLFCPGTEVVPCAAAEFPAPAVRPAYSVLENARLKSCGMNGFREWKEALSVCVAE